MNLGYTSKVGYAVLQISFGVPTIWLWLEAGLQEFMFWGPSLGASPETLWDL